jgi:hypothetical protein
MKISSCSKCTEMRSEVGSEWPSNRVTQGILNCPQIDSLPAVKIGVDDSIQIKLCKSSLRVNKEDRPPCFQ